MIRLYSLGPSCYTKRMEKGAANPMRAQVFSLPALLREQFEALEARSRRLLPTSTIFAIRETILTGCGDSQIAGALLRDEWQRLSGMPTRALNAMAAARYETALPRRPAPQDPLVVAVSVSGGVARTIEAAEQWRARGAATTALTANADSDLARAADYVYELTLPQLAGAGGPGVRSFLLAAQALYLWAVRLSEVRGRITQDEAGAKRARWLESVAALADCLPGLDAALGQLAAEWQGLRRFELLGSGPARAAAAFGAAKILEASGHPAIRQDIEEWVHLQYFAHDPDECGVLLLSNASDAAYSRAREIAPYLRRLGRPCRAFTDERGAAEFPPAIVLPTPPAAAFAPFLQCAALALFAARLSECCGAEYGRGGRGRWQDCADGRTTRQSARLPLPERD